MRWSEMEGLQPRLAGLGRRLLLEPGVVLVATIRGDGTPRVSPVEPWLMDGILWLSMMWQSTKAADLVRDSAASQKAVIAWVNGRMSRRAWRDHKVPFLPPRSPVCQAWESSSS